MGNRLSRGTLWGGALLSAGAVAATAAPSAGAAAPPPTSETNCSGSLVATPNKALLEPNSLNYSFSCDGAITAYTIVANQQGDQGASLDDYNAAPSVFETDDATPSPTESITCEGTTPSDGINCNTGAVGASITLGYFIAGSVDPIAPYCAHLPTTTASGKPVKVGTPAVPTATVQVVVTDITGAQDGPFALKLKGKCPKVAKTVGPYISFARRAN